ncbi:MAG: mechanosensitive ion channel [Desulfotignum sp.]|nr:mechanosensitive ion channel [Desulfotignum sp.]MCF8138499.1 mechanosensitive ion channel [Desulfotignum sp.]
MTDLQNIIDIQAITTHFINYLPKIISALILLVFFWLANKIVQKVLQRTLNKMIIEKQATNLLLRTVRVGIYVFACLTVADQLQINIKSLLAGVGVVGLAVSFGAKDTIANIISGVVIIIDKPFREDDWISMGSMHATVSEIRLRTTVLTTFDNETVVIPNQQMSQERIVNYTISPKIRVKVPVGIAYKEDISHAKNIILDTVEGDKRILPSPAPAVVVTGLADSSVNLQLRFWIENPTERYSFMWEYTEKCKKALDDAGVEIPFPHLQLFVEKTEGIEALAGS